MREREHGEVQREKISSRIPAELMPFILKFLYKVTWNTNAFLFFKDLFNMTARRVKYDYLLQFYPIFTPQPTNSLCFSFLPFWSTLIQQASVHTYIFIHMESDIWIVLQWVSPTLTMTVSAHTVLPHSTTAAQHSIRWINHNLLNYMPDNRHLGLSPTF